MDGWKTRTRIASAARNCQRQPHPPLTRGTTGQFVREWAALRHDEILANWERARRNEPLLGIDPLA
jgi:hypothetical protein